MPLFDRSTVILYKCEQNVEDLRRKRYRPAVPQQCAFVKIDPEKIELVKAFEQTLLLGPRRGFSGKFPIFRRIFSRT